MKIDICIDGRMINHSGIGTYLKALLPILDEHYRIAVLGIEKTLRPFVAKGEIIPFSSKIYSIKEQLEYLNKIPDCTVFWSPHYNVPIRKIKAKSRIVTIHDVYHLAHIDELDLSQKIYAKKMFKAAYSKSNLILTVSEFSKNEIIRYIDKAKAKNIKVIPNALPDISHIIPTELSKLESTYGIKQPYLLSVGNQKPNKNLSNLIAAFDKIDRTKELSLILVGENKDLINKASFLQDALPLNVISTGKIPQNDLFGFYKNAHLFCFPSLYEGFGYPLLEARFFNIPIVCSDLLPHKEVAGENARLFDPTNIDEIQNCFEKSISDREAQYEEFPKIYSIQNFKSQILESLSAMT